MGTEKWFYIVIVCCIAHEIASEMRTYNGDKVLRISYQNNGEFENVMAAIYNSMLKHAVEIWSFSENDTDSFLDVHVEGNYFHKFSSVLRELNVEFHVFIDDVQRLIDDELDSMERTNENKKVRKTRQAEQVPDDVIGQFANVSETMAWLDQLVARYDIMEREVIGKTYEGRDIVLFKIGVEKPGVKKPAVWVDAATHAREWISPSSLNYLIFKLLQSYVDGTEDRKLVEELDWYLVPIVNPDGYQYTFDTQRLWRKNRAWSEEHSCYGTDINRNYPYQWGSLGNLYEGYPCLYGYRGPEPGSENETQAIMSSILSHSDSIQVYVTLHSYSQLVTVRWAYNDSTHVADNYEEEMWYATLMADAIKEINNRTYRVGNAPNLLYPYAGGSPDWVKAIGGVPISLGVELPDTGDLGFLLTTDYILPVGEEVWAGLTAIALAVINTTTVLNPTTTVLDPTTTVLEPTTTVLEPTTTVLNPTTTVLDPTTTVLEPTTTVLDPTTTVLNPTTTVLDPTTTSSTQHTTPFYPPFPSHASGVCANHWTLFYTFLLLSTVC